MTRIILALCALLSGLIYVATTDWRGQGAAACLFKDASGALQMECRR